MNVKKKKLLLLATAMSILARRRRKNDHVGRAAGFCGVINAVLAEMKAGFFFGGLFLRQTLLVIGAFGIP